jgi:flagellar biosynthesis/type III secretory pathway protein FliH
MKDALVVAREEGTEDGIEIGREEGIGIGREEGIGIGREKGRAEEKAEILSLIKQGYSLTDIENMIKAQLGG